MNANAKLDRNKLPLPDKLDHTHAYIEPRTLDEKIITRIYADVLNREKIGIDDGFFDLGGHSLLAVKVINELRKQLNREGIPLTIIFQFPTARQMAMHLQSADIFQFNDMVCLQAQGNEPPLFLVPGSDGFGIIFTELARQVAELSHNSRPVYSFQYPKLFKEINFDSIESLASYYVQRILSQQKTGPYFIAGWSMGGIVAYEMCKQLTAQGFQVEFLGILDITPDFNKKSAFAVKPLIASFLADGRFGIPEELLPDIIAAIEETPEDELINSLSQQLQTMNNDLAKAGKLFENLARNLVKTLAESEMLLNNYVLSGKVNKISYFSAAATGIDKSGWQKFCSDKVKTYTIPGDHFTMLQLASAQMIAKEILTHK